MSHLKGIYVVVVFILLLIHRPLIFVVFKILVN
jgi:hypothetical protein